METKLSYDDYQKGAIKLFKKIFGNKLLKQAKNTELKSFDWKGVDYSHNRICSTSLTIKQRYANVYEDDEALSTFINSVFLYGYNQACEYELGPLQEERDTYRRWVDESRERSLRLKNKIVELEKQLHEKETN